MLTVEKFAEKAVLKPSSYPHCIQYHELDVTRGCSVKCIYCSLEYFSEGVQRVDVNLEELEKQIQTLKDEGTFNGIYLSPNTDAFSKICADTTHEILEYFLPKGVAFMLTTKSIIPQKTIQLLAKYPDQLLVKISLSYADQELLKYVEPGSASATDRLKTMKALVEAGIEKVQALLIPLFPGVDDDKEKITALIDKIKETGVRLIKAQFVVIREREKPKDIAIINKMKNHPELKKSWELMTETIKIQVGGGQILPREKRFDFYKMMYQICSDRGMIFAACCVLDSALYDSIDEKSNLYVKINHDDFPICNYHHFLPDQLKK